MVRFTKVRKGVITALLLLGVFLGGYFLGVAGWKAEFIEATSIKISREVPPDKNVDFSLFWQVWDTVSAKYYDKTKIVPSEMVYGAIEGMVSALGDPYTMFLPPKENKVVEEDLSGSFEGVGIEIGFKEGRLAVVSPLPGSPAEKAGVKAGDFIVHIKDEKKNIDIATNGISLPEAVKAIRGPAGSKVTLTLIREGTDEPIVVELTRAKLNVPSITLKFVGSGESLAHIKINKFGAETTTEWATTVAEVLNKQGIKGVILDLRNNPGGYLQASVDLASEFVKTGTVIVIEEHGDGSKIEYKSERIGKFEKMPVVILINGGSASASEILSGALRDIRRAKLIGEKSFGKGTVQEPIQITGGSGLHVTTAKWLTPSGTWVHEKGLEPDVKVTDDEKTSEDEQLQAAIKALE